MNVGLNAAQARANSSQDMIVYKEVSTIMEAIIASSDQGKFQTVVPDGTTMTESTPQTLKIATVNNPVITSGSTLEINGATIVLGTSGTNLNCVVADINDAEIPGVVASKDGGYLVLEITGTSSNWEYSIGAGTANVELGLTTGNYMITAPNSVDYFSVWQGTETERALQNQMNQVIKHFVNLGFKIEQVTNTATGKTFSWNVYW
jgi:hypothetical protein